MNTMGGKGVFVFALGDGMGLQCLGLRKVNSRKKIVFVYKTVNSLDKTFIKNESIPVCKGVCLYPFSLFSDYFEMTSEEEYYL